MPSREEDALSWEGDDDPTLSSTGEPVTEGPGPEEAAVDGSSPDRDDASAAPALPTGWRAVGRGSESVPTAGDEPEEAPTVAAADEPEQDTAPLGNAALVSIGLLGGIHLIWTIGWLLSALKLRSFIEGRTGAVADFMYQGSMWLAVAAPAIWFAATLILTRRSATWKRILGLVAGAVVLLPWPFLMVGI